MVSIGLFVAPLLNVRTSAILLLPSILSQKLRNLSGAQWYEFHIKCTQNLSGVFRVEIPGQIEGQTHGRTPGRMDRHDLHYTSHVHMG
jgi:hypothetical protein